MKKIGLGLPKPAVVVELPVRGGTVGVCRMAPYDRITLGPEFVELQERAKTDNDAAKELITFMAEIVVKHCRYEDGKPQFTGIEDEQFVGFDALDYAEIVKAVMGAEGDLDAETVKQARSARRKKSKRTTSSKRRGG